MPERRLSFLLVSTLLTLSLGGFILTQALHQTIGKREQTKNLIHKSGLYEAIIPSQLAQMQKDNPALSGLPLDNPEVQKAVASSLDTYKIKVESDAAIDTLYRWLEGNDSRPTFSISAMPDRSALAADLGDLAYKHALPLPTCTSIADVPTDIATNPLAAKCLPPGITAAAVRQLVIGEVSTNQALGTASTITSDDIKLPDGTPVLDKFNSAPTWYQPAQMLPKYLGIAALIFMLLLLLILRPLRGMKSIGKHLLSVGITLALCAFLISWGTDWAFNRFIPKSTSPNVSDALMKLTSLFDDAYRNNIIRLSAYAAAAGLALYGLAFVLIRMRRRAGSASSIKSGNKREEVKLREPDSLEKSPPVATFTPAGPPALPSTPTTKATKATKTKTAAKPARHKKAPAAHKPATRRKKKP